MGCPYYLFDLALSTFLRILLYAFLAQEAPYVNILIPQIRVVSTTEHSESPVRQPES